MKAILTALVGAILLASLISVPALAQASVTCEQDYTVSAGDWLSKISEKYLGSAEAYQAIAVQTNLKSQTDFSFATVVNPDSIQVGWKLCIPSQETADALNGVNPPEGLDKNALANATYTSMVTNGQVTLKDGVYETQPDPTVPLKSQVMLTDQIAYGELNGVPSAAVVTGETGGGSGYFYLLHIMQAQDGKPVEVANTLLGDRSPILATLVQDNQVLVDMITQGPDEPFCCATLRVLNYFTLDGTTLNAASQKELGNLGPNGETPGAPLTVTGEVFYRERIAMPQGAVLTVRVEDVSRADAPAVTIGEEVINDPGNVPVKFSVQYDGSKVEPQNTYAIRARIEVDGQLMWTNTTHIPVITNGAPTQNVQVLVQRVGATQGGVGEPLPVAGPLTDLLWQWQGSTYKDGTSAIPTDASKYSVTFGTDGRVTVQADCNSGGGPYQVNGSSMSIGPLISTLALCPEGSLSSEFLRDLEAAATYTADGGTLTIQLKDDAGTMTFISAQATTPPVAPTPAPATPTPAPSDSFDQLTGSTWVWTGSAYKDGTTATPKDNNYTIIFGADDRVAVQADCNQGGGPYSVNGSALAIGPLITTLALCPEGSLDGEFMRDLDAAASYSIESGKLIIQLKDDAGSMTFDAAQLPPTTNTDDLVGVTWKWTSLVTDTAETKSNDPNRYTVEFTADGQVNVKSDCNTGSASYTVEGEALTIGPIAMTKVYCGDTSQDSLFTSQLQKAALYSVSDGTLMIATNDNSGTLNFIK